MRSHFYASKGALWSITDTSSLKKSLKKGLRCSYHLKRSVFRLRCQSMDSESGMGNVNIPDMIPVLSADTNWRDYRAALVDQDRLREGEKSWAHQLPAAELGCLLLAHPLMFTQHQVYFNLAVILIFVHGENGSAGLILNKPTQYRLGDFDVSKNVASGFEECPLFLGGDVGDTALHVLHEFGDLEQSTKVIDGVYLNGFEAAQRAVLEGSKNPNDFHWYTRYCGWRPKQLEEECKRGVWFPVACSPDLVVKERCFVESPADDWHQIMQLMGGEYQELSNAVLESYIQNRMGTNQSDEMHE